MIKNKIKTRSLLDVVSVRFWSGLNASFSNSLTGPSYSLRTTGLSVILSNSEESILSAGPSRSFRTTEHPVILSDSEESLTPSCHSRILPLCHSRIYCGNPVEWISGTSPNMTIRGTNPRMTMGTCHSLSVSEIRNLSSLSVIPDPIRNLTHNAQYGRTMVETISVLAIMGVLGVAAIAGFRGMIDKNMANAILEDAQVAYINLNSQKENVPTKFEDGEINPNFKPVSENLKFYGMRDPLGQDYIKVTGIEKGVCQQLLRMQAEDKITFYNTDDEEFTTCKDKASEEDVNNEMVFAFNGQVAPAECATAKHCDVGEYDTEEGFPGYCTSTGRCQACNSAKFEIVNNDRTGCDCDTRRGISCSGEEDVHWCCGNDTLCGWLAGTCVADEGCWYKYSETSVDNSCHYTYSEESKDNSCHYEYSETPKDNSCNYELTVNGSDVTLTPKKKCLNENQYCYLDSGPTGCGTTVTGGDTKLWGKCNDLYANNAGCSIMEPVLTPEKECQNKNQYCYLDSTSKDCTGDAKGGTTDLWGKCNDLYANNAAGTVKEPTLTPASGHQCDDGQYCYLDSTSAACTGDAQGGTTNLWGKCNDLYANNAAGTVNESLLTPQKSCPPNYYCYLGWTNDKCTESKGGATTLYGGCSVLSGNRSSCPAEPEWDTPGATVIE